MKELLWLLLVAPLGVMIVLLNALTTFKVVRPADVLPVTTMVTVRVPVPTPNITGAIDISSSAVVTDIQRYALALAAGWSTVDALVAVALSIAEDGSGNPTALSPQNKDGSRDFCLWQVNSGWWPQFGGQEALAVPINCARAANTIYHRQGWCAWSTYNTQCGPGHTGTYLAFLCRAQLASGVAGRCN